MPHLGDGPKTESASLPPRVTFDQPIAIIGAGPAGLTAAYELTQLGAPVVVYEQDPWVGGLARTVEYKGFRFDIGGHRFFTKVIRIQELWRRLLGKDFLERPRLSRIYYRGKFFNYPITALNALVRLGLLTTIQVLGSYICAKLRPIRPEVSFADWVSNRFGRKLYRIFFETYTYKVWGIPPATIDACWAAQRVKGLSLRTAIVHMLRRGLWNGAHSSRVTTLIQKFEYPRLGPGMMWETMARRIDEAGGRVDLAAAVVGLHHDGERIEAVELVSDGRRQRVPVSRVISTMPIRTLIHSFRPALPSAIVEAADRLKYRDFITVALIVEAATVFPDNWIYIHDDTVKVGRIQNFKNWSPDMTPDPKLTGLGLEYFCFEGDGLWSTTDAELIALGTRELQTLGIVRADQVVDGCVVRVPKAYPVYDKGFTSALETLRDYLNRFQNLQLIGRNGMHKYNNQDHSMLTAMRAVENLYGSNHDLWSINADDEYHEDVREDAIDPRDEELEGVRSTQPRIPTRLPYPHQSL